MKILLVVLAAAAVQPRQICPHGWHRVVEHHQYACVRNGAHGPHRPIMLRDLP